MRNSSSAAILLLLCAAACFAQNDRGTITGTVTDPAGAVVPGASITSRNVENGSVDKTVTTGTGDYTIPSVPAGTYELTVESPGFSTFVQKGIRVQVAQTARIDVVLKIGATGDTITITADATLLKTESAEQSSTISSKDLLDLPINFTAVAGGGIRNPLSFVILTPGGWYQPSTPSSSSTNVVRVNGQPNTSYKLVIDGQDATNDNASNVSGHNPPVEAVEEFTLQTSNFAAEYGQIAGGMFNFTSKSGTNQYHGSGYEYFANTVLNAATPYTNVLTAAHKNDLGFSVGGPVILPRVYNGRNRTFFFFSLERYIDRKQGSTTYTVPTTAMRAGDFSSILTPRTLATISGVPVRENTIYDPQSDFTMNGAIFRTPFTGNVIPPSRFDPVALKIQSYMPSPQNGNPTQNYVGVYPYPADQMIPSIKMDHNFNTNSKLSFYFQYYWSHIYSNPGPDALPKPLTSDRYKFPYSYTERLNYDHTLTPHLLVHLGAGEQRYNNNDFPDASIQNFDSLAVLGLAGAQIPGFPRMTGLSGSLGGFSPSIGPGTNTNIFTDKWTAVASATYIRGSHTYKLGGEWQMDNYADIDLNGDTGTYGFSAAQTGLPATQGVSLGGGSVGYSYASFLLGAVNTASINGRQDPRYTKQNWSLFIQDDWKVNRKLTVNYGLRWDLSGQAREIYDRNSNFAPSLPNPAVNGLPGAEIYVGHGPGRCNCDNFYSSYPYAIGPRLGVAWQIDSKTVFRGGWGVVYGQTSQYNYLDFAGTVGVGFNRLNFSNPAFDQPALYLRNGLQYNTADLYKVTLDPGARPDPGTINSPPVYFDRNAGRPPRIFQWNISLQREIGKDLLVEAAYVGSRSAWYEANGLVNLNAIPQSRLAALGLDITNPASQTLLTSTFDSGRPQAAGYKVPYPGFPTSLTLAQSLRPYPQFGGITVRWAPLGNSWYDALQAKVTKRYSHGLTAQASFTWQKELSTAEGTGPSDVFNRANFKAISPSSQPLVLATGFTYQLPSITKNWLLKSVVRDWTVGGVLRYASGLPIPVSGANNVLNSYVFQNALENRVPGVPLFLKDLNCHCFDPAKTFVLNPAAWSNPANGVFGTAAPYYNDYRFQRRPDDELSLARSFHIREHMTFMVRAEFFNIFNRAYPNNPVSGNPQSTQTVNPTTGATVSGFGMINTGTVNNFPRHGQLVARFQW